MRDTARAMRVVGFLVLVLLIGLAIGVLWDRILLGVLVPAGILIAALFILIARASPPGSEP